MSANVSAAVPQSISPGPAVLGARTAATAGIGFAVLLFVSVATFEAPHSGTDAELTAFWTDPGNLHAVAVSTFAYLLAGLCFLVFAAHLRSRLAVAAPSGLAVAVIGLAAPAFVAMLWLTGSMGALARGPLVNDEPGPGPDLLRYLPQIRYTAMGVFAVPAVAVVIAAVSWVVIRDGGLPAWTGWLGVVCILPIIAFTAVFRGQYAIPAVLLWAVCLSVTIVLRPQVTPR